MRNSSKLPVILVCVVGIIAFTGIAHILWSQHRFEEEVSPYASYTRLINLARGMDGYKQHSGQWPTNLAQLVIARPDLESETTDAYGRIVILVSYNQESGYGELISYGKDGKPGGDNKYDRDIEIRFPVDTETNAQWNSLIKERFKNRADRGFPN